MDVPEFNRFYIRADDDPINEAAAVVDAPQPVSCGSWRSRRWFGTPTARRCSVTTTSCV
jgi:hypothetical protein